MQRAKRSSGRWSRAQASAGKPAYPAYFDQWRNWHWPVHGLGQDHCAVRYFDHPGVCHHRLFRVLRHAGHGRDAAGQPADGIVRRPGAQLPGATGRLHSQLVVLAQLGGGGGGRRGGGRRVRAVLVPRCAYLATGFRHHVPVAGPEHAGGEGLW
ncbi:hypothetical protein D3C75_884520 [compost metagenome]